MLIETNSSKSVKKSPCLSAFILLFLLYFKHLVYDRSINFKIRPNRSFGRRILWVEHRLYILKLGLMQSRFSLKRKNPQKLKLCLNYTHTNKKRKNQNFSWKIFSRSFGNQSRTEYFTRSKEKASAQPKLRSYTTIITHFYNKEYYMVCDFSVLTFLESRQQNQDFFSLFLFISIMLQTSKNSSTRQR